MTSDKRRPSPDELLAHIEAEEKQEMRGRLKIFLGYAAGVGKTYAMLEAARQRKKEIDVAVGYVETHGRVETEALLEGLEVIPRKKAAYHGMPLTEMDIDAILARRPRLALVDELAHSNAAGSRHAKRYQDVDELLEAGIDVYTTLNVQHVDSLQNVVAQVTGVWVRELVPDSIIDHAYEIEIVDLPPDELLKRLQEGKVYISEQIGRAAAEFFRKGNLIALRELTMRTAAQRVDDQMRLYMGTHDIRGPWKTSERLMVLISEGSLGSQLVRETRRLASQLHSEWFALYVETPGHSGLPQAQQERLESTIRLAERMGAKVITAQGQSIAATVAEYANANNITKIIVGKPLRKGLRSWFKTPLVNQVINLSERYDVYVISKKTERVTRDRKIPEVVSGNVMSYMKGLGLVALATLLGILVQGFFAHENIVMIYLLCIAVTAFYWGLGPSIGASFFAVLAFDFFFIPPFMNFTLSDPQYLFTFIAMAVVSTMISYLMFTVRRQADAAKQRERQTSALYALGRELAVSTDLSAYVNAIVSRTKETFDREAAVLLPDRQNPGTLQTYRESTEIVFDEKEMAAATWSYKHQKAAGQGTDTLPNSRARYLPLVTARGCVGVLVIQMTQSKQDVTRERERLLGAYADLIAVAIESMLLAEEAHNAETLRATEKLQNAFLNSISLDLSRPVATITSVLERIQKEGSGIDTKVKTDLLQNAMEEARMLNHVISNVLDMSKIEAGLIRPSMKQNNIREIIDAALAKLDKYSGTRKVKIYEPSGLTFVAADFNLLVQALVNILDNAFKYSPEGSPLEIHIKPVGRQVEVEVADRGVGIPPGDLENVFEKFYRVKHRDNMTGSALGLTISRGLIEAHEGKVTAENRPGGGTIIKVTLPEFKNQ